MKTCFNKKKLFLIKNVVLYIRFLTKNVNFNVLSFSNFPIFQFLNFFHVKLSIYCFFIEKCCITKMIVLQKFRFLHNVFNEKCKFICFFLFFYVYQFLKFFSCETFNLLLFNEKIYCSETYFFSKMSFFT